MTKHWGDEPAKPYTGMVYDVSGKQFPDPDPEKQYKGFTKLERACIDLKVTDPSLDPKLRELILESRRLDYAGQALQAILSHRRMGEPTVWFNAPSDRGREPPSYRAFVVDDGIQKWSEASFKFADSMISELEKK